MLGLLELHQNVVINIITYQLRHNMKPHSLKAAEEFLKWNGTIKNVADIFHSTNSKLIVIEGAAGIGKTYLCKEIASQWSQGQLLTEKKTAISSFSSWTAGSVSKISKRSSCMSLSCQQENDESIELIACYLQDTAGESLTLILDGYSEVSEKIPDDRFINRIVKHACVMHAYVYKAICKQQ